VIFVPFYTIIFPLLGYHLEPAQAVEVGLLTEIFGFISSTTAFWRAGLIDFQIAGFAVLFAAPMAVLGGYASHIIPSQWMLVSIGIGLMGFSWLLFRESDNALSWTPEIQALPPKGVKEHTDTRGRVYHYRVLNDTWRGTAASVGGIFQGLVGFSAGELSTVEQVLRGMPPRMAAGNAHLIIAGASITAALTHLGVSAALGTSVPWNILAATIPAVMIGGQLAALVAGRVPQHTLRLVLSGFLLFVGGISLYRASAALHMPILNTAFLAIFLLFLVALTWFLLRRRGRSPRAQKSCCSNGSCKGA
jgi:uncharacterized membrane protein YfcA